MNYFELYPGDYLRDTTRLSLVEHGAYLRLMLTYYSEENPLPADHEELYVIASATDEACKAAIRKVADRFFPIASDGLRHNKRVDDEIVKARKRIETARTNGAKNKPKNNQPAKPSGEPSAMQTGEPEGTHLHTRPGEALHTPPVDQKIQPTAAETDPIFGSGLDFLKRKGLAESPARSFLGLLRKELRDDLTVAELLVEAERQDVSDPAAWLRAAAKNRKAQARAGPQSTPSKTMQGISALEGMKHAPRHNDTGTVVQRLDFERPAKAAVPGS